MSVVYKWSLLIIIYHYYHYCHIMAKSTAVSLDSKLMDRHQEREKEGKKILKAKFDHVFKRSPTNNSPSEDFTDLGEQVASLLFYGGQYMHIKKILKVPKTYLFVKF